MYNALYEMVGSVVVVILEEIFMLTILNSVHKVEKMNYVI
jgi:hypothetical protein